jgi:serine phosphatase RsbU (regulator of sigma subunit)
MEQEVNRVQTLAGICKKAVVAKDDQPVRSLINLFQEDADLSVVPVFGAEGFLDCISRKSFFNLMSRPFAQELYAKDPIHTLLKTLHGSGVVMEADRDISGAAIELLSVDPTLETEAFPLVKQGYCVGVVEVSDLMLAVTREQERLLGELERLSSRIREEVARATKIQQDLLPQANVALNGVTIAAGITTSSEIGGDFFDYFKVGEDKVGLVIADVSGHGVQAGMVTTAAKASLHTLLALGVTTPAGLLAGMNNAILQTARQTLLMTCLIACLDMTEGTLTIANAGHNFPYLLRRGGDEPEMLDTAVGFPLGFETDNSYGESRHPFGAGDSLFLYTDGIVECSDASGEELGYERLSALLRDITRTQTPDRLHKTLMSTASGFTGTSVFDDDVTTLLAVRG